jgi:hypothetical protein
MRDRWQSIQQMRPRYVGTSTSEVYKSTNSGAGWTVASIGDSSFRPAIKSLAVDPASPNVVYAGLTNSGVSRSTNGGMTWSYYSATSVSEPSRMIFDTADGNVFYMAGTGSIAKTTDRGATWQYLSVGGNYRPLMASPRMRACCSPGHTPKATPSSIRSTRHTSDGLVWDVPAAAARRGIAFLGPSGNAVVPGGRISRFSGHRRTHHSAESCARTVERGRHRADHLEPFRTAR